MAILRRTIFINVFNLVQFNLTLGNSQTDKENYIDFRLRLLGEPGEHHPHCGARNAKFTSLSFFFRIIAGPFCKVPDRKTVMLKGSQKPF